CNGVCESINIAQVYCVHGSRRHTFNRRLYRSHIWQGCRRGNRNHQVTVLICCCCGSESNRSGTTSHQSDIVCETVDGNRVAVKGCSDLCIRGSCPTFGKKGYTANYDAVPACCRCSTSQINGVDSH